MSLIPSVLDDADDETARLIIKLQLDDAQSLEDPGLDHIFAIEVYRDELKAYAILRGFDCSDSDGGLVDTNDGIAIFPCNSCLEGKLPKQASRHLVSTSTATTVWVLFLEMP